VLVATLFLGLATTRLRRTRLALWLAWALVLSSLLTVERLCAGEPPGWRMLAIIGAVLWSMKAVVSVEAAAAGQPPLTPGRWLAFAALWPGMRPAIFASLGGPARPGAWQLLGSGALRIGLGVGLVVAARWLWLRFDSGLGGDVVLVLATMLLLTGLSLVLHFGLFNLLAGAWRLAGADCKRLFRAPLLSTSLAEFWGRRWNLAFTEMTAQVVYRPLAVRLGKGPAILSAFLFSGVLHELAISLPVRAGFGLPLAYFILHGILVLSEGALARAGRPVDRHAWLGRSWTLAWLVLPLPMLFHLPFLRGVVWPLLD
jgi:alginate O-acetyltransferase complex protein AlgI